MKVTTKFGTKVTAKCAILAEQSMAHCVSSMVKKTCNTFRTNVNHHVVNKYDDDFSDTVKQSRTR